MLVRVLSEGTMVVSSTCIPQQQALRHWSQRQIRLACVAEACVVKSLSPCQSFAHLQREGHGNLWLDRLSNRMVHLPTEARILPRGEGGGVGVGKHGGLARNELDIEREVGSWMLPGVGENGGCLGVH